MLIARRCDHLRVKQHRLNGQLVAGVIAQAEADVPLTHQFRGGAASHQHAAVRSRFLQQIRQPRRQIGQSQKAAAEFDKCTYQRNVPS